MAAWGASQVAGSEIPWSDCPAGEGLENQTVRNVLFVKGGGSSVRVRVTNTFGTEPVTVDKVTVALQDEGADAVPGTLRTLTFGGHRATTLAAGEERFSDPVRMRVRALSTLLVSVHQAFFRGDRRLQPVGESNPWAGAARRRSTLRCQ
ncbi:hypothetical protein [Streptomyces xinghaiensis]|uniref:hypothetical protein n=1 Tax=Streptomyces xinghaiensis TaxID=1038928 RepID=UPI00031622C8|nr:hypothetical protein [Streptomyces xinghaiensis]MZE75654.1 hypothetical protein [Streptomyces sp. SID5475]